MLKLLYVKMYKKVTICLKKQEITEKPEGYVERPARPPRSDNRGRDNRGRDNRGKR